MRQVAWPISNRAGADHPDPLLSSEKLQIIRSSSNLHVLTPVGRACEGQELKYVHFVGSNCHRIRRRDGAAVTAPSLAQRWRPQGTVPVSPIAGGRRTFRSGQDTFKIYQPRWISGMETLSIFMLRSR